MLQGSSYCDITGYTAHLHISSRLAEEQKSLLQQLQSERRQTKKNVLKQMPIIQKVNIVRISVTH